MILLETRTLLRESLAYLLQNAARGMTVESCASVETVQPGPADLILIGPSLAKGSYDALHALISEVRSLCHRAPVAAIGTDDDGKLRRLQPVGLVGIVEDTAGVEIVVAAVRLMVAGASCFPRFKSSGAAERDDPVPPAPTAVPAPPLRAVLTLRELQVLARLREGRRNKVIALELGISDGTVKVHVRSILKKLGASNRTEVALRAARAEEKETPEAARIVDSETSQEATLQAGAASFTELDE